MCIVPYEVARHQGYYRTEGLDVELVYLRGGTAAMQALVTRAVDYAATSFDVALSAYAQGAPIRRFFTTGRLPLFALAVAPKLSTAIRSVADLRGRTVGVSALGNADHVLLVYLLKHAGVDARAVRVAVLGPNTFETLHLAQVDAAMVQDPAATLIARDGGRILADLMDLEQAKRFLGGPYEFMGVAVRRAEWDERRVEMQALARALTRALGYIQYGTPRVLLEALPQPLIAGGDGPLFEHVLATHRRSLFPPDGALDLAAVRRAAAVQRESGVLARPIDLNGLVTNEIVKSL
jgi:sulfonate transport system substrate-binding protein